MNKSGISFILFAILLIGPSVVHASIASDQAAAIALGQTNLNLGPQNQGGSTNLNTLYTPTSSTFDSQGNLWVADSSNNRVLEFNPPFSTDEAASVVLGQTDFGSDGGGDSPSMLSDPTGVAFDSQGNLWVTDYGNNRILEFPEGNLITGGAANVAIGCTDLMGGGCGGPASSTTLSDPTGVAFDSQGNLWVTDTGNNRVLEFPEGNLITGGTANVAIGCMDLMGGGCGGPASQTTLSSPIGPTAFDSQGNLWIPDSGNARVLEFAASNIATGGAATIVLGQTDFISSSSGTTQTALSYPRYLAFDPEGNLWVDDYLNHRALEYLPANFMAGGTATFVIGQADLVSGNPNQGSSISSTGLAYPEGVALDSQGNLWVTDAGNSRVLEYVNPQQTPTLVPSNVLLDSGQTETYTASWDGGATPFTVDFYNVSGTRTAFTSNYISPWSASANSYPTNVESQSCITYSNNIYCIAGTTGSGNNNEVYYAPILPSGEVGSWSTSGNFYPTSDTQQSCVTYSSNIYCIGGYSVSGPISTVNYAPIFPSGEVGAWTQSANSYPIQNYLKSCVTYSNNIYCIAGVTRFSLNAEVYYAPIFPSGEVGAWTQSANSYPNPNSAQSCVTNSNSIYCIAGFDGHLTTAISYAPIFQSGEVGAWSASANSYPIATDLHSCTPNSNNIYCIGGNGAGGAVYYSTVLNSGGTSAWQSLNTYPVSAIGYQSCVTYSNTIYCIAGANIYNPLTSVYYAPIAQAYLSSPASYTFTAESLTNNYNPMYNVIITDSEEVPATTNSITNTITVNPALSLVSLLSSNSEIDQGQTETLTYDISGGTPPYTYNFIVANAATGNVIANQIFTGCTLTTNSLTFTLPSTGGYANNAVGPLTITGNVMDSASTNVISITTNTIVAGPTLTGVTLSTSNTALDSGQTEIFTAGFAGGLSPFTVNFFNVTTVAPELAYSIGYKQWLGTSPYPTNDYLQSCIASSSSIYCIGGSTTQLNGQDNSIYYAPILLSGQLGPWSAESSPYPTNDYAQSCVTNSNTIYCIGGSTTQLNSIDKSVYYAPILGDGNIGAWNYASNSYPTNDEDQSCIISSGNIYCIGGFVCPQLGCSNDNSIYYAQIFGNGNIGSWSAVSNSYPTNDDDQSCVTYSSSIYCIGGTPVQLRYNPDNSVYYAPILGNGDIGTWSAAPAYPTNDASQSCIANSNTIYCIAGCNSNICADNSTYYAPILPNGGIGSWIPTTGYPTNDLLQSCVASSSSIYCIGGQTSQLGYTQDDSVYYAPISAQGIANTLSYSFQVSSPTDDNAFSSNVVITDATGEMVSSATNTFTVSAVAASSTTTIPQSGGGINIVNSGGGGGGESGYTTVSTTATTTAATTTLPIYLLNSTYNITQNSNTIINVPNAGTIVVLTSSSSGSATVSIINVTGLTTSPQSYIALTVLNITTASQLNVTTIIVMKYQCSVPSNSIAPYELNSTGTWNPINPFTVNTTACTVTFAIPTDPVVGLFKYQQQADTSTILPAITTSLATSITTTVPATVAQFKRSNILIGIAILIAIIIVILAIVYIFRFRGRKNR